MRHACPCCGFLTVAEDYDICPVCFWEDDPTQRDRPDVGGGANEVSLEAARESFRRHGVSELRFRGKVRPPRPDERPA